MASKTWTVSLDHSVADTDTGADWGNSADQHHPIGLWSGWTYRSFIKFTNDWTSVKRITEAELRIRSTTQVHVGFGTGPRMYVQRVTGTFSTSTGGAEASWTSSANPVYPGPTRTSTNQKDTGLLTTSENVYAYIDVTALVEDMAPTNVQKRNLTFGAGNTNNGLAFISYDATTTSRTWEFYSYNSSYDPIITLTYETTWLFRQYGQALAWINNIVLVSSGKNGYNSAVSSTLSIPLGSTAQKDDLLIAIIVQDQWTETITPPSGWHLFKEGWPVSGDTTIRAYRKVAVGGETSTGNFGSYLNGPNILSTSGVAMVFRSKQAGKIPIMNTSSYWQSATYTTTHDAPGLTAVTSKDIYIGAYSSSFGNLGFSFTAYPSGSWPIEEVLGYDWSALAVVFKGLGASGYTNNQVATSSDVTQELTLSLLLTLGTVYTVYGQAKAQIEAKKSWQGLAQARIKKINRVYGQARTRVLLCRLGLARTYIVYTTYINPIEDHYNKESSWVGVVI